MTTPITHQNNPIGEVFTYLTLEGNSVEKLVENIKPRDYGLAGFREREHLKNHLKQHVLDREETESVNIQPQDYSVDKIGDVVEDTLTKTCHVLPTDQPTEIYLFPTVSEFTKENLGGVDGYAPYRHTIHLYLHPKVKHGEIFLQEVANSVAHEYNHAVRFHHFPLAQNDRLVDTVINEGLADNFCEEVLGGEPSPWSIALTKDEAQEFFHKVVPLLDSASWEDYQSVFFGTTDNFPLWAGYAIGYHLVKDYLQKQSNLEWPGIIKKDPEEILAKSAWQTD